MSIQLSTIQNPKESLAIKQSIPLENGAIQSLELNVNINQPNQLKVAINPLVGKELYDFFLSNKFSGLRLQNFDDKLGLIFDMAFIELREGRQLESSETGESILLYESLSSLLSDTESFPRTDVLGVYQNFDSNSFFRKLTSSTLFEFDIITSDSKKFFSGFENILESINLAVDEYPGFQWRETGIVQIGSSERVNIEIGKPEDRPFRGFKSEKLNPFANNNDGQNIEIINPILKGTGAIARSLIPRIENAQGADPSSTEVLFITNTNKNTITEQSGFPLLPSGFFVQTSKGLVEIYKVVNLNADETGYGAFTDIQTPSSFNEGGENVSITSYPQIAYDRAVSSLQSKQEKVSYEVAINTPFILPAGEPFDVLYIGQTATNQKFIIDERQYIGSQFVYDISNFVNK